MSKEEFDVKQEMKTTIQRGKHDKEHPYVYISKSMLRDKSLSPRDKGALCYLLSLPDNWVTHPRQVAQSLGISKNQMYSILKELIKHGYATKKDNRSDDGRFSSVSYLFYEEKLAVPQDFKEKSTVSQKPDTGIRDLENGTLQNTDSTENISKELNTPPIPPQIPKEEAKAIAADAAEEILNNSPNEKIKRTKIPIEFSSEVKELAAQMVKVLHEANPHWLIPKNLHPLMAQLEVMISNEKREPKTILDVFMWAVCDSFWMDKLCKPNPAKYLRDQFGQLAGKMLAKIPSNPNQPDRRLKDKEGKAVDEYKDLMF